MPAGPLRPWSPGAAPQAGKSDPEAFRSAGCPISGHLAALAASPPSPVSGALISLRRSWARPDFFPSVSRLECPPLSWHHTASHLMHEAGCSLRPPFSFHHSSGCSCFLGTPLLPVSWQFEPKAASSGKPFPVYCHGTSRTKAETWTVVQGPPPTLCPRPGPAPILCVNRVPISSLLPTSWGPQAYYFITPSLRFRIFVMGTVRPPS